MFAEYIVSPLNLASSFSVLKVRAIEHDCLSILHICFQKLVRCMVQNSVDILIDTVLGFMQILQRHYSGLQASCKDLEQNKMHILFNCLARETCQSKLFTAILKNCKRMPIVHCRLSRP
jgi:hypothetical protein